MSADTSAAGSASSLPAGAGQVRKRRWEAADTLIAGAVALVALIVGIFVVLCIQGYASTIETTKARGQTAADVVAEGTRWVVAASRSVLDGIDISLEGDIGRADAGTLADFQRRTSALPTKVALGLYDADGNRIAAASSPGAPVSIADRDYFARLTDDGSWMLTTQQTDVSTGLATFGVVRRIGSGTALLAIDARVLETIAEAQDLGDSSTVSIVRSDGWVIARSPSLPAPLDLSGTPAFANLTASSSGSYVSDVSPADGKARIVSFRHVDDLNYIAIASISREAVLAGLWDAIWIVSWLIAPIAVALLVGSFLTARLVRRTQSTSRSLSAALENNEVLFREIHHRVKNNLQSVNSLVQLQPIPREVKAAMNQRIAAMSAVHEHIYRSHTFATVQVKNYLHTLIENIRAGSSPDVQVIERIEDVAVDKDSATPLGLIVNEVVSNAFKHAFNDGRHGAVTITLVAEGEDRAVLTVADNGVGFDPEAPASGIGRRLIRGLSAQLQGESTHVSDASGSVFTLSFPLARG